MRTVLEHQPLSDRKGLTRNQLNLPITRTPITIQSSASVRSPVHQTAASAASSPMTTSPATALPTRPVQSNAVRSGPVDASPHLAMPSSPVRRERPAQGPTGPPHLRISSPHQPKPPNLNLHIPQIRAQFESSDSSTSHSPAPAIASIANARRASWSPSQAIPEGHYSKGFTLTTFQKTADKAPPSSSSTPSSLISATPSSASASSSLKRSNTNHLQRRETLTPFRRLVGRSKSMKVKTPGPFVGMDTESALRTERFTSFYNDDQENTSPHTGKPIDRYDSKYARYPDQNTPEDLAKHSNSIQAQDRVAAPSFDRSAKPVAVPVKAAAPARPTPQSALTISTTPPNPSNPKAVISTLCHGPSKPLWQHTMTNAEQISALGLTSHDIQKQETIFELIYTESEYLDDLKSIHKIFVEELNVKMAEARRKKRFSIDKADVKLYERLARLLSHIKDLWNGHQSLLRSLQNKQQQATPVVEDIGSVFESFYMFSIYDSYFAQYTTTSRDFQHIAIGNSELCLIIKDLLKSPRCKSLTLEGIFLKPIQRLQKYPLFFKDLMNLTPNSDPDHIQLEHALNNHQRELTKIDDRIWIEEHNEMLADLQQRIKGLPSNFSLVERHRYLILDGPVHRITVRQPSKFSFGKHGNNNKSDSYISNGSSEWRDGFRSPVASLTTDDDPPILIHRPSQLDYHHLHARPAFPSTPPPSSASSPSSSHSALTSPSLPFPLTKASRTKSTIDTRCDSPQQMGFYHTSPSSPPSTTTLHSLSSVPSPIPIPNSDSPSSKQQQPTVSQLVSQYNFSMSSSFSSLTGAGHPRNISSSALYLPGIIKNSTDIEAEYHAFIFTDIVLWTKRVMSRYHRKEGIPWNFKLVEPVSRLTSVCNTSEDNIFMCTSVNTNSASYLVRTEDEVAARMWKTTVPTLVPFHCSRNMRDRRKK